jgi:hypothetical protein
VGTFRFNFNFFDGSLFRIPRAAPLSGFRLLKFSFLRVSPLKTKKAAFAAFFGNISCVD